MKEARPRGEHDVADGWRSLNRMDPYIIDSNGREIGRISDAFPTGGYGRTDLYFSQWVNEFPRRITTKVFHAGALGDYTAPPLQWNTKTQYYNKLGKTICDEPPPQKQH